MKKILTLIIIFISVTISTIPAHAETRQEAWLRKQKEAEEKFMDGLEKDGNLTQDAIDSISSGTSKRKANKKSTITKNKTTTSSGSASSEARGWVYGTDELHITGLPTDERGYTKAGDYGRIEP